jgi:hypothetical protein
MKRIVEFNSDDPDAIKIIVENTAKIFDQKVDDIIVKSDDNKTTVEIIVRNADKVRYSSIVKAKSLAKEYVDQNKDESILIELQAYLEQFTGKQKTILFRVIERFIPRKEIER